MKTKKNVFLSVIVVLIMALLVIPGSAVAQAIKTDFVGTSTGTGTVDPGVMTFPGGNVHIRGMVIGFLEESSDPRASGTNTVVMNANWDSDWTGPMWGTFLVVNEYGTWEGTYTGVMGAGGSHIRGVAHGTGELAGLIYSVNCDYTIDPAACIGQILNPHGQ
jgi:hypothetical protein